MVALQLSERRPLTTRAAAVASVMRLIGKTAASSQIRGHLATSFPSGTAGRHVAAWLTALPAARLRPRVKLIAVAAAEARPRNASREAVARL